MKLNLDYNNKKEFNQKHIITQKNKIQKKQLMILKLVGYMPNNTKRIIYNNLALVEIIRIIIIYIKLIQLQVVNEEGIIKKVL